MADSDLIKLYSGRILELAANIPRTHRLPSPDASVRKRSPLCGSTVTVDINMSGEKVTAYGQEVKACALGQAAASVVGDVIVGSTRDQIVTARDQLKKMLKEGGPVPKAPFQNLEVLKPAAEFKNRHASILLTLEAAVEAMEQASKAASA
ncbi:iron-sulfur cluster assembly scaffold protein [Rhodobacteraceae bacterium CCMM004]|nr:iron-sulfur cluster assembly scaffold protein [Rhodobacteraceae bacterium CCMM004]